MRKQVFGRKFKRDKNERKALFNGLISAMILKGSITTTEEKAKSIKGDIEKLVTKAKRENKRLLQGFLKPFEIDKLINEIAPTFAARPGGYTRIIKTGRRFNDNASMVILQWVDEIQIKNEKEVKKIEAPKAKPKKSLSSKKTTKAKSSVAKAKEGN